eukprot:4957342-Prymnesium_polylepis.1
MATYARREWYLPNVGTRGLCSHVPPYMHCVGLGAWIRKPALLEQDEPMLHDGNDAAANRLLGGWKEASIQGDDGEGSRCVVQHEARSIQERTEALDGSALHERSKKAADGLREAHLPQPDHKEWEADGPMGEQGHREEERERELSRVPSDGHPLVITVTVDHVLDEMLSQHDFTPEACEDDSDPDDDRGV